MSEAKSNTPVVASAFITGLVFAIGLGISGMTDTTKVIGFLSLNKDWNPALMLVMGGAIAVHAVVYRIVTKRQSPLFTETFHIPTNTTLDGRLIGGAVLFGLGWGMGGVCPGPGLVSVFSGTTEIFVFVVAMIVGMLGWQQVQRRM
mgnify:CR=1 FL=1